MRGAFALSLIGAALFSFSLRPWGNGYFAIAGAIVLVVVLMNERTPWRGAALSAILWLGLGIPTVEGVAGGFWWGFAALLALLSVGWVGAGALFAWLRNRLPPGSAVVALPVLFTAVEFLMSRTWLLGNSAAGLLAYTQSDTPLLKLAAWSSTSAINAGVLMLAAGLYSIALKHWKPVVGLIAPVVLALVIQPPGTGAIFETAQLRAGVIQGAQGNLDRLLASYDDQVASRLAQTYEALIRRATDDGAELAVLGETVLPRRSNLENPPAHLQRMLRAAPVTIVGAHEYEQGHVYNSAVIWNGTNLESIYRKRALVPLIEGNYTAGNTSDPVMIQGALTGVGICLDSVQAGLSLQAVRAGAELLIFITDDSFAGHSATPHFHIRTAAVRAAETARATVFANEWGPSAMFDRHGRTLGMLPLGQQGVLVTDLPLAQGMTPFVALGDYLGWIAVTLSLIVVFRCCSIERPAPSAANIRPKFESRV